MDTIEKVKSETKYSISISEPKQWKVVFLNDDVTPMTTVISLLMSIFNHTPQSAEAITLQVHENGSGVAGVYSHEIAETKTIDATEYVRAEGYPLQILLEEAE